MQSQTLKVAKFYYIIVGLQVSKENLDISKAPKHFNFNFESS